MDIRDRKQLYKIVRARDKRYDGRFYCGVHTTGVYCRPICPARPKLENISFYRSAAEAEKQGFRACLRCRPDLAPYSPQWHGTAAVVSRALAMIARGEADEISAKRFAARLGITDRHLRRLFEEHVGASPLEVASSKRLHLARQLLTQSGLPVTEVAFASGFRSLRRFNEAFKQKFHTSPRELRRTAGSHADKNLIYLGLPVIAPYDWEHIYGFLRGHAAGGVEDFSAGVYRRGFADGGAVEVGFDPGRQQLNVRLAVPDPAMLRENIERIRDLFDTRTNPHLHLETFGETVPRKDTVALCYRQQLGLRIPGAWNPFETAVCIVLGQLVSVEQARMKIHKLVQQYGTRIRNPVFAGCTHLFPEPAVLARADYRDIGVTRVRAEALRELSRQVQEKKIDLARTADIAKTRARLLQIKGIGPWTVEMIAMRCLGDTNAFPANDLIIKRALQMHGNEKGNWSPWNAYIALALWKKYAASLSQKKIKSAGSKE